jgi:hypothetical protein
MLANLVTTVTPEDDHWVVTGAKYYATGDGPELLGLRRFGTVERAEYDVC